MEFHGFPLNVIDAKPESMPPLKALVLVMFGSRRTWGDSLISFFLFTTMNMTAHSSQNTQNFLKVNFWNCRGYGSVLKKSYLMADAPDIIALNENTKLPNFKKFDNYQTEEFNGRSYVSLSIR